MDYLTLLFHLLIFPGFLFTAVLGLFLSWLDRKVTARVQMRVGPRLLQPFYDIIKYMVKETCVPEGASRLAFLGAPVAALAATIVSATLLWQSTFFPQKAFAGDLIVAIYLLTIPAMCMIIGAFASRNPLASLGGSREIKMIMAYELPFLLAILVPVIKTHSIQLGEILQAPAAILAPSGVLALLVAMVVAQAKMGLVPFDASEAETELAGGAAIEYSGPPLGLFKLTRVMLLAVVPLLLVTVWCGGIQFDRGLPVFLRGAGWFVGIIVVAILMRNTAPRVRIDQAVRFFWGKVSFVAAAAVALALLGW